MQVSVEIDHRGYARGRLVIYAEQHALSVQDNLVLPTRGPEKTPNLHPGLEDNNEGLLDRPRGEERRLLAGGGVHEQQVAEVHGSIAPGAEREERGNAGGSPGGEQYPP